MRSSWIPAGYPFSYFTFHNYFGCSAFSLPRQDEYFMLSEYVAEVQLNSSILSLSGKDTLDFLQRLSTNDVKTIRVNGAQATILINEKAKIVEFVTLLSLKDNYLLFLESNNGLKISQWLDRFLFTEDVKITDVSANYDHLLMTEDTASQWMEKYPGFTLPKERMSSTHTFAAEATMICYHDFLWKEPVYHLLVEKIEIAPSSIALSLNSAVSSLASRAYEVARVEEGIPSYGKELTELVNPLEAGLERFISWTKGCYIGQEVIARIDTYKKLQRKLTGFILESAGTSSLLPGKIMANDEEVGWTTSHIWSKKFNKHLALGYLKTNFNASVIQFQNDQLSSPINATISSLPFSVQ